MRDPTIIEGMFLSSRILEGLGIMGFRSEGLGRGGGGGVGGAGFRVSVHFRL